MHRSRRPPRKPRTEKDDNDIPPDPKSSSPVKSFVDHSTRCLLEDLDGSKMTSIISGFPAGRGTALLLQAIRQQLTVAASTEYTEKAVRWVVEHDILMLKQRKQSLAVRLLLADAVDSRDQMSRLINAIASFSIGRQYLSTHLRTFLPTVIAVLRGRRLPSSTQEQLIAIVQKMSIRSSSQRELLQSGMLEWLVNLLETARPSPFAMEYAGATAINLSMNPASFPLQMRFADSIAAAAVAVLSREAHGTSCSLWNGLVMTWIGCGRVRVRARETRLADSIRSRLSKKNCPLCSLHVPYLLAIIAGEAEVVRVPQPPNESDVDTAGNSCEREIDSLDPLRPTSNELSGARLLLRRAAKEVSSDDHSAVPGQVPRHSSPIRTTHGPKSARSFPQPRLSTAASSHTFTIETERRRPLLLPLGLTDGAVEYKKQQDEQRRQREEEARRLEKEREKAERERSRSSRPILPRRPLVARTPIAPRRIATKAPSVDRVVFDRSDTSSPTEENSPTPTADTMNQKLDEMSSDDYAAVFGARPKVARTPEHSRSFT